MRSHLRILAAIVGATLLSGCATTQVASAEERARCEEMAQRMGMSGAHSHGEVKGQPRTAMNKMHDRCRKILRDSG